MQVLTHNLIQFATQIDRSGYDLVLFAEERVTNVMAAPIQASTPSGAINY